MADATYGPKIYKKDGGDTLVIAAGGRIVSEAGGSVPSQVRTRLTTAQVNAGVTLLPAVPGLKYRLLDASAIAVGGAATTVTTVDLQGTQAATGVKLVAFGQAALTQGALVRAGSAGGVLLADGASFAPNDVNTPITVGVTGSAMTVATAIDVLVTYALEP